MIEKGTSIRFLKIDVINTLSKNNNIYEGYLEDLFKNEDSYYQFITFNFIPSQFNGFVFSPSFIFFDTIEVCEKVKISKENNIICYTQNFVINLTKAIERREIEILEDTSKVDYGIDPKLEFEDLSKDILMSIDNYINEFETEKEMINHIANINSIRCFFQGIFKGKYQTYIL